nr:MAG TPA: hypothetical protein [Caudoviricetes sp.]
MLGGAIMENNNNNNSSFSNFLGMLTILFIGLKLTGFISWSWFWVLSPIIFPIIVIFIIFLIMF